MKNLVFALALLLATAQAASAQPYSRYLVKFTNKVGTPYTVSSPQAYLSARAIARRTRYGIAVDSTDFPITPRYLDSVRLAGAVTILNPSRWLNQVSIQTTDAAALAKIAGFPFVQNVAPIAARTGGGRTGKQAVKQATTAPVKTENTTADFFSYGASYNQVHIHNGEFLHNIGLRGQGMVMGILDGGFFRYNILKSFDSINANGQVLGTWDFVAREQSVTEDDQHGMQCFSIIGANIPGQFVGTAPKASFYLFRSEDGGSEYQIEEHNWVCATERVDSSGGDMISSSLGYSDGMSDPAFNHTYAQMNGNTTIAAIGADMGAKKGLLIANAAGNDGQGSFRFIATPADGDSVMAVGAVTAAGAVAGFSSFGPSSDGQVKPDVASVGVATVLQGSNNNISAENGTSFSCPNIAGLALCLWQGFQEFNNIKILNALRQAGSRATAPDNRVGYGIPDVKKATMALLKDFSTAAVTNSNCRSVVSWTSKDVSAMRYEVERRAPGETVYTRLADRQGTGAVFSNQTYQYTDTLINVQAGAISYRIRQVIDTAAATFTADYIDTVSVNLAAACVTTAINPVVTLNGQFELLPNPATTAVTLRITGTAPIRNLLVHIINNKGQQVAVRRESIGAGVAIVNVPVATLSAGGYFMVVYNGGKKLVTLPFIKL